MENLINYFNLGLGKFKLSPKYTVCLILLAYNILGITVLGFNRSFEQVFLTTAAVCLLQMFFDKLFKKEVIFPLSAITTGLGLSILLNYGHSLLFPLVPVFLAIASKFFFTFKGKHIFNPGLMGVVLSLLLTNEFISPAPAYQWNGLTSMSLFIIMPSLFLFMPKINRHYLVGSFLVVFVLQLVLRSILIKHYLPFNTLFFGTITSPPFFLFVFFMITDPATTPSDKKKQIIVGVLLALFDLFFHLFKSYHTFFYAALLLGSGKLIYLHTKELKSGGIEYLKKSFIHSGYFKRFFTILFIAVISVLVYKFVLNDFGSFYKPDFKMTLVKTEKTGMKFSKGEIFEAVDPRVQHMGKWILAISDGVAVSDFNNDGLVDVFFTNGHKSKEDRNALFLNTGNFTFKRFDSKELSFYASDFKKYGVPSNALFVDYDNDGDKDLYITYAFGSMGTSRLFVNKFIETGSVKFVESTKVLGLEKFSNSATANFFDFNNDGLLDLVSGNTIRTHLENYKKPTELNLFSLPQAEYEGDERMFDFMHDSWHMSNNGSENFIFLNQGDRFKILDPKEIGMPETRWTMAIGTADFNQDGWTDLYMANDFGADDLYYNQQGKGFINIKGKYFGDIGKDTYKGMNATVADFDRNGMSDVYISNVHHPLQAEGSLLWSFFPGVENQKPKIIDNATAAGSLNENRFGWGASSTDFNNDGHVDLVQANGMVDNKFDKKDDSCPDYWYINEKIARSPPSIHRFINKWGDLRGMCIHGFEKNRMYLNRGVASKPQFIDIADKVGMDQVGNWRGMASGDFNNDGKMDLIVSSLYRDPLVFKNEATTNKNHWIGLSLTSTQATCNRDGIGSVVKVNYTDSEGISQIQRVETKIVNGFSAQDDTRVHFGLGAGSTLNMITVNWCKSNLKEYTNLKINNYNKLIL
ncbi:hypothetical protein A9Q84_19705 [Halobacteriovorax marinus]|uniref:ASPIC/UnbV domain-containing protein n=1 Tax=Halobacteriovorax marinus TaxID=97084 RepID=A0A1Y5F2N2_9BACT|nr:hypothetical protein A9Q84_19705 [Halobacteriovorax marinus]